MTVAYCLLLAALSAAPATNATTLDGDSRVGALVSLSEAGAELEIDGQVVALPLTDIQALTFPDVAPPSQFAAPPAIELTLTDGSRLACTGLVVTGQTVSAEVEGLGAAELSLSAVRSIRLGDPQQVADRWAALLERDDSTDLLVVRKETALDFVPGTVGGITAEELTFVMEDRTVNVPRAKVFGVVFAATSAAAGRARLIAGRNELAVDTLEISDAGWQVALPSGAQLVVPVSEVSRIDFAGGVRNLTDLPVAVQLPEGVTDAEKYRYVSVGGEPWGAPLRIGAEETLCRQGLWLHSEVAVRYRINREYRRLTGIAGMDHNVGGNRSVRLVIEGDDKSLLNEVVRYGEPALPFDLDVTGVRDLEIRVERLPENIPGNFFGTQEHLDIGFPRLIK
jgi:hypothetical protein